MECPTCKYPVPAEWSLCRRCGAPLHTRARGHAGSTVPAALAPAAIGGRRSDDDHDAAPGPAAASAPTPPRLAAAAASGARPADTLLPGALPRPDNLLPRATRRRPRAARGRRGRRRIAASRRIVRRIVRRSPHRFAREHWRRILVLAVVAVALTLSLVAVWPVLFRSESRPAAREHRAASAREARATGLLRTVVGGGRTLFAAAPIVRRDHRAGAQRALVQRAGRRRRRRAARAGQVSMR